MKTKSLFLPAFLLLGIMVFSRCSKNHDENNPGNSVDSESYGFDIGKVSSFDYMIANKQSNSSVFYNVNPQTNLPAELYFKPYANDSYGCTIKFRSDGLPDLLMISDTIVVFENYRETKVDIAVIYPNISVQYHYNVDIGTNISDLIDKSSQLRSAQLNTSSTLKFISMGLSVASIAAAIIVPTPASPFIIVAAASSLAISSWSVGNYFFEDVVPEVPPSVDVFGAVLGCGASMGWGCFTGALATTASVMEKNLDNADFRDPLVSTVKAEMRNNDPNIDDPDNPNNPNNPDSMIDKTVILNLTSTVNGGGESYTSILKQNGVIQLVNANGTGNWEQSGNSLRINWTLNNEWHCTYRLTGTLTGNSYTGTYTHYDGSTFFDRGTFFGAVQL